MPKSKRNKQVELTKTAKHGMEGKKKLYQEIQSSVENYAHLFIFSVSDMRNAKIKYVRDKWRHSRFFIGKNKVMALALGKTPENEFRKNLHKISEQLKGERGLLFSNQSPEEVLKWFSSYSDGDYARSGNHATETVVLKEGPLKEFSHNVEPYLRQLGLPTTLKKGVIHLIQDHTVCNEGDVLTPENAKILKLLGYQMAEFMIKIECVWSQDGSFKNLMAENEPKENITSNTKPTFEELSNSEAPMEVEKIEVSNSNILSTKESDDENESDKNVPELVEDNLKNGEDENLKNNCANVNPESMEEDRSVNDNNNNNELDSIKSDETDDSDDEEIPTLVEISDSENVDSANSAVDTAKVDNKKNRNKASKQTKLSTDDSQKELRRRSTRIVNSKK